MVKVRIYQEDYVSMPESLGRKLGLQDGDQVELIRNGESIALRLCRQLLPPPPLTDLSKIISSSLPPGSVDVETVMDNHGYEQIYGRDNPSPCS
jgi:bifunctional DNA-binding transcriptional regulator/antitoxin component of YhaV-PrlF toxin-antitoxin module